MIIWNTRTTKMKIVTKSASLCAVVCLFTLHLTEVVHAIYDPKATTTKPPIRRESILPWYLNGSNSHPPDDGSRSPKWSQLDDFGGTQQLVEPSGGTWGNWRKVSGSEIEQRTEIETPLFSQIPIGHHPPSGSDQAWVNEPFEKTTNFDGSEPSDGQREIFYDDANLAANRKNLGATNIKYKPTVPADTPNLYEGVVDSKKPRQERILVPFHSSQSSNVAKYDQRSGVQCPNPHATGQFVYPPDCKFFVNCHQGRAFVQPCAPGTLFNPETLECDFPHKVRCYGGEIADFPNADYTDSNSRREPLVNSPRGPHQQHGAHHANVGNEPRCLPQQSGHFPHPSDCTKFIQCANGGTFVKDCGPGTVFNPTISVCDWPYNVMGCEDAYKKNDSPSTILTPPEVHPHENYQTAPSGRWKPMVNQEKKIECPPGHSGLLPHPETCKKFLQCANGITYIMDCGPGTAFNPEISVCDWPYNVPGCSEERTTQKPRPTNGPDYWPHQPNWNNPASGNVVQGRPIGQYDQNGSPTQQQGGHVVVNGHQNWQNQYENRGESQIGNQWQPGHPVGIPNNSSGANGQGRYPQNSGKPTLDPLRPFQPIPTYKKPDGIDSQAPHDHNQYHNHHHHDHDGPGPWSHPGHGYPAESDEEGLSQVQSTGGNPNGWQHRQENGPGSWNHPGHDHGGNGNTANPQAPSPGGNPNGWQHHHNHHQHNGPGPWDQPGHNHGENGDKDNPQGPHGNPTGWQHHHDHDYHHRHNGPGPWNHPGHNHGEHGEGDDSQVSLTPDKNPNRWQPENHHQDGYHNPSHNHGNENWNWGNRETTTEGPNTGFPNGDREGYGRTNPNFPGQYDSNGNTHAGWNPSWNSGSGSVNNDRMKPSQPLPAGSQPGVFVPSPWRGQGWNQPGQQGPKPIPTSPPKPQWSQEDPPFPVYYVAPVLPMGQKPRPMITAPGTGQILRLRGGSSPRDGYLEVQGAYPGWGVVCDSRNGWSLNEAHVVCRQLGYTRGAEMAWQGRAQQGEDTFPWIAATDVNCKGNETRFQDCKFVHDGDCQLERDSVGIRCMANRVAHCGKDEVAHDGQCYHLAAPDSGLNHAEALEYCATRKSQLVDITSQAENNFLSEWLIQNHPEVTSIMTSGVGFSTFNRTIWMWEDSARAKFQFSKWWPGWMKEKKLPPSAGSRPVCIVMKKEFPCQGKPESKCPTDYFFWDIEDCASSMKGHSYVCERPYNDISCVYGKGQHYAGSANVSISGKDCLPWKDQSLAHALRVNVLNHEVREKLKTHNYCRNPNPMKESRPWCFTGLRGEREYCDIPSCGKIETPKSIAGGQCKPKHFECMPGECIPSPWVCDGDEDCTNGLDEKLCSSNLEFFQKTKDHKLEGHAVQKWLDTPPKTCALRCKEADFTCRSFSHKSEGNVCFLSDTNVGLTGDLHYDVAFDYYEMIDRSINCDSMFVCGNQKCINQTQVCDGKNNCGDRTDENICSLADLDYEIRLAGSNNSYEGRLEVKVFGHWGQVCDDGFGMIDANVVCKELGFNLGALEVRAGGYYGNLDPPERFMVDQLKCRGNETSLRECDFDGWGVHNCRPEEAVGVVCKSAVNTCQLGHWKCDDSPTCIPTPFICDEVVDCPDGSDENSAHCDAPFELRLVNGSSPLEGRVEVRHHGVWGTVCDDDFSQSAAAVICKSLGYGGKAIPKKNGFFGPGDGPIWLDEVYCHGNEPQLYKCEHDPWGRSNCDHEEDAGVICTEGSVTDSEETVETTFPVIDINDLLPSDCGKRAEDFGDGADEIFQRVVRGSIAPKGAYPWQASIRVRGHSRSSHWCGAVVLSPLHVLTAAHCLEGYNKGTYFVRAGDYNSEIDEGTEVEANIEDYYIHEEFRKGARMNNDIALVRLKGQGIPLGEHVMPICLPPANVEYSPGLNCTISGFGSIETGQSAQSLNLRYGWIPLIDQSVCRAGYVYGEGRISDGMVCAGFLDEGVDACDGDSGGPLACLNNGAYTLYGLTSWGHHCGEANKPGVYVRIAYYRDWIERKIRESLYGR